MRHKDVVFMLILGFVMFVGSRPIQARQTSQNLTPSATSVPQLITFNGVLRDGSGVPITGVMSLRFAIYKDQNEGAPIWSEVQNVQPDQQGQYTVLLGAYSDGGLPTSLFSANESRWLGVQANVPGATEQPRALLVSVPYALKAADAETLGGKPVSAFALASSPTNGTQSQSGTSTSTLVPTMGMLGSTGGTPGSIGKFGNDGTSLVSSVITESSGQIGIGTATPGSLLDVNGGIRMVSAGGRFDIMKNLTDSTSRRNWGLNTEFSNVGDFAVLESADNVSFPSVPRITITNNGNVGIGTTSPGEALDVNGGIRMVASGGRFDIMKSLTDSPGRRNWGLNTEFSSLGGFDVLESPDNVSFPSVSRLSITSGGSVGIGTTTPAAALDVNGTVNAIHFTGDGSGLTNVNGNNLSGTIANNLTSATSSNNANSIVLRDGSGNFTANMVTAGAFIGNGSALTNVNATSVGGSSATVLRTRGIVYLGGCDSCSVLQSTDSQRGIFINVVGAMTINSITCYSDAGSPIINVNRNPGTGANPVLSSNLTCSPTGTTSTSIAGAQAVMNSNDTLDFAMITPDGVAKRVTVAIQATIN